MFLFLNDWLKPYSSKAAENLKWIARALCRYVSYLHLQLFGGGGLQLGGHGALQGVSHQRQALTAMVRNGQNLTFHRLPVHPVTLQERKECEGEWGHFNIIISLSSACEEFELQFKNGNMLEKRMKLTGPRPEMVAVLNVSHSHRAWAELAARWHE